MNKKNRICPLCESDTYKVVKRINKFKIVQCRGCCFVYVVNPFSITYNYNECNELQDESVKKNAHPRYRHLQMVKLITQKCNGRKEYSVLEIGSGKGELGHLLSKEPNIMYQGFEPSHIRYTLCKKKNLSVTYGQFEPSKYTNKADAIIMDNVLEHVMEPTQLIKETIDSLNKGGILIIAVPNVHDVRRFFPKWRKRHYYQPHCHINYFKTQDLKKMFRRHNLSFHPFALSSFSLKAGTPFLKIMLYLCKIMLDSLNISCSGIYCYGIKK